MSAYDDDSSRPKNGTKSVTFESEAGSTRGNGKALFSSQTIAIDRQKVKEEHVRYLFFPWNKGYMIWWGITVFWSIFSSLFATYQIAFEYGGLYPYNNASAVLEFIYFIVFLADIFVKFNLAYYDERDRIIYNRRMIARHYLRKMFWVDLVAVFPFFTVALLCTGLLGVNNPTTAYLSLLSLFRLLRLYRVKQLFDVLEYNTRISLMWLTLIRNVSVALVWTHFAACTMFFIARMLNFGEEETWIGDQVSEMSQYQRYVTSLYWSVVTFATVGYGDYSPVHPGEQIFGIIYMLMNMIIGAWFIGSITLLIVKSDEKTGLYRETLQVLDQYAGIHSFDSTLTKRLKKQLKLEFNNREIADEQVLGNFPCTIRRKLLRHLYMPALSSTSLMHGIRQQFVDAFLSNCRVEIFSPGEEILQRGSITSDLYLLVEGTVKLMPLGMGDNNDDISTLGGGTSIGGSEYRTEAGATGKLGAGDFINDITFFTESPCTDTVLTSTICKTLTMCRSVYKSIAEDHPGSTQKLLQNLLDKVQSKCQELGAPPTVNLPKRLEMLKVGSVFNFRPDDDSSQHDVARAIASVQNQTALTAVEDLIKMHINKQKDNQVTRFLFAASRDDTATIGLMCGHGFDPDNADYDSRTALMVASMKGTYEAVAKLLEYQANPNLVDMHGTSALYEAVKNGNVRIMEMLEKAGAKLCMEDSQAASVLCQAVYDGDILVLRRLLQAGISVNASDYDKRTAVHIAAAEGNVAALRVLDEFHADFDVKDRWGHSVEDEARRANAGPALDYLRKRNGSSVSSH